MRKWFSTMKQTLLMWQHQLKHFWFSLSSLYDKWFTRNIETIILTNCIKTHKSVSSFWRLMVLNLTCLKSLLTSMKTIESKSILITGFLMCNILLMVRSIDSSDVRFLLQQKRELLDIYVMKSVRRFEIWTNILAKINLISHYCN